MLFGDFSVEPHEERELSLTGGNFPIDGHDERDLFIS
jgi:hypothetical protein